MKEKIIEKRVMKMKKVFVTLLMLMMVVGLFAATQNGEDSLKVQATIGDKTYVTFSTAAYTTDAITDFDSLTEPTSPITVDPSSTDDNKASFYASAYTNKSSAVTLRVYGTALTLQKPTGDSIGYDENYTIPLTVKLGEDENNNLLTESTSGVRLEKATTDASKPTIGEDDSVLKLTEKTESTTTRGLTGKLEIIADVATDKPAGTYDAYIWLDYTQL